MLSCDASAVGLWDPELADLLTRREPLLLNAGAVTPTLELMLQGLGLQAAIGGALLSGSRLLGAVTACWRDRPLEGASLAEATALLQGVAGHTTSGPATRR